MPNADDLICAVLRGDSPAWPWGEDAKALARFLNRSDLHGTHALLHAGLASNDWPPALLRELRTRAMGLAMWELRHQQVLAQTLEALAAEGVRPVLLKGTALAYSLYSDPALRTRGDTDLIIPIEAKDPVHALLVSLGYQRNLGVSGEWVSYQASYSRHIDNGGSHTLDLHWKINNSELLSRLFTYDELYRDAVPLPRLSPHALGTSRVHALLLACMHRSTHKQNPYYVNGEPHYGADRLIWLYDIHLLAGQLNAQEWDELASLAAQKGLCAVCLESMRHAQVWLQTAYPESVLASLAAPGAEPAARYLDGTKLRQQWMDFCALGSGSNRMRFARELFFPPAAFMRSKYADRPSAWLPWLYLRRAAGGVAKGFMGNRSDS